MVAVSEVELRALLHACWKASHAPGGTNCEASRSMTASPNRPLDEIDASNVGVASAFQHGVCCEPPAAHRLLGPVVTHSKTRMVGEPPPCAKSYRNSKSPAVRPKVTVPGDATPNCALLNSKSMLASPLFEARVQPRYRKVWVAPPTVPVPPSTLNLVRSFLFGGMPPKPS